MKSSNALKADFSDMNVLPVCVINSKVAGQCGRCQVIGIDQGTGTKAKEPLMSLSSYRMGKVGQNQLLRLLVCVCVCGGSGWWLKHVH